MTTRPSKGMSLDLILVFNLLSNASFSALIRPCTLRTAFSTMPLLCDSPTKLFIGIVLPDLTATTCLCAWDFRALLHAPPPTRRFPLPGGATIMSTTYTPSLPRSHSMCFVILFSMYDLDVSNTTLCPLLTIFPSALLKIATWKVTVLNYATSAVDMISVFSHSFSTVLPSAVVQNTPRLDPSDSTVLWFGNHVYGVTVSAAPLSTTNGRGMGVHSLAISHSGSLSTELLSKIPRGSGDYCILLRLLTHFLHMTLMYHCRNQTSLCFLSCFVFLS